MQDIAGAGNRVFGQGCEIILENPPVFSPIVAPFYSGMEVTIPLFPKSLGVRKSDLETVYSDFYKGGLIYFNKTPDENAFLSASKSSSTTSTVGVFA